MYSCIVMFVRKCPCMYARMYVCIYACMYVCIYYRVHIYGRAIYFVCVYKYEVYLMYAFTTCFANSMPFHTISWFSYIVQVAVRPTFTRQNASFVDLAVVPYVSFIRQTYRLCGSCIVCKQETYTLCWSCYSDVHFLQKSCYSDLVPCTKQPFTLCWSSISHVPQLQSILGTTANTVTRRQTPTCRRGHLIHHIRELTLWLWG